MARYTLCHISLLSICVRDLSVVVDRGLMSFGHVTHVTSVFLPPSKFHSSMPDCCTVAEVSVPGQKNSYSKLY